MLFRKRNNTNYHLHANNSRAGAKRRAGVLIPLGDFIHSGILTKHSGIQSCPKSVSWTLDVQWSWLLCACSRLERAKTGNPQPPDWLMQKVCISIRTLAI